MAAEATAVLNREVFSEPGLGSAEVEQLISILTRLRLGAGDFESPA